MIATIILLTLLVIGLGIRLALHGKPMDGTYNVWPLLLIDIIYLVLYYYAGLFDNFK